MKIIKNKDRTRLVKAAMGEIPCDLSIEYARVINVLTGEIYLTNVDILDGIIVRTRPLDEDTNIPSKKIIDAEGHYLAPGFIDTHMHVESTMMVPENFGKAAIVWGTTTAVTDPHEIANVLGITGVNFMLESAKKSPLRIFTLAPSCVPAVPSVESAGATFRKEEIEELLKKENVIGIAEVMDYLGVINNDKRMRDIIDAGEAINDFIQGHAPFVSGKELCAYLCGGPVSDHETRLAAELKEKLRLGMHINIKSSSLSDTVQEFLKGIRQVPIRDLVSLCTDDVHAADLLTKGHINHIANELYKGEFSPIEIVRFGSINAAREIGFEDIGAIAPGYVADLQLLDECSFSNPPLMVFSAGELVAKEGNLCGKAAQSIGVPNYCYAIDIPKDLEPNDFKIPTKNGQKHLIFSAARSNMTPGQPLIYKEFKNNNGFIEIEDLDTYQYCAIVNRYGSNGITKVVCSDFNLAHGCVASTISHDSHNMTIVYRDPNDAYVAAQELKRIGGGMCFVEDGEVRYSLPLPVGGLMSNLPVKELAPKIEKMEKWVDYACDNQSPMLLAIAILALPVRPGIIITDKGVVRGETLQFVPLVKEGD